MDSPPAPPPAPFIPRAAKNPNGGNMFLASRLSRRAQTIAAGPAELYSLRADVVGEATIKKVEELIGDKAKPVPISPELLATLDQKKRLAFLKQWQAAMKGQ